jgi:hypothetical protein
LAAFFAVRSATGVQLEWETASEVDIAGFVIWRGDSPDRKGAMRIHRDRLTAHGASNGAAYRYLDTSVQGARAYTYWLDAVRADDTVADTLRLTISARNARFLPMVQR